MEVDNPLGPEVLEALTCPDCEVVGSLVWENRLLAHSIGTFALAGQQMKVSASMVPHAVCRTRTCAFVKAPSWRSHVDR